MKMRKTWAKVLEMVKTGIEWVREFDRGVTDNGDRADVKEKYHIFFGMEKIKIYRD